MRKKFFALYSRLHFVRKECATDEKNNRLICLITLIINLRVDKELRVLIKSTDYTDYTVFVF